MFRSSPLDRRPTRRVVSMLALASALAVGWVSVAQAQPAPAPSAAPAAPGVLPVAGGTVQITIGLPELGIVPAAKRPALLVPTGSGVVFPVTGGRVLLDRPAVEGRFSLAGALVLRGGGRELVAADPAVDLTRAVVTARVGQARIPVLALDREGLVNRQPAGRTVDTLVLTNLATTYTAEGAAAVSAAFSPGAAVAGQEAGVVSLRIGSAADS